MRTTLTLVSLLASIAFASGCMSESPSQYVEPEIKDIPVSDKTTETFTPQADILFVIDNSYSMDGHQKNLASNIDLFVTEFLRQPILSYNISVITTDTTANGGSACCGKFQGSPRVVNKKTLDGSRKLASNMRVGTGGSSTEAPFRAVEQALDPTMLSGWNQGFLRKNSALVIVFLTDANDQSPTTPLSFYNFLVGLRNGNKNRVFSFGAIIPSAVRGCDRSGENPPRKIEEFLALTQSNGTNIMSLCSRTFGVDLALAAAQIVEEVGSKIYLSRAPDVNTIRVFVGNTEFPNDPRLGWTFNPESNAIVFGSAIDWENIPPDVEVRVDYKALEF